MGASSTSLHLRPPCGNREAPRAVTADRWPPASSTPSPPPRPTIERIAANLTANNIEAVIVQDGAEAREKVLERIPEGAQVHTAKSKTMEDIGLYADLNESGSTTPSGHATWRWIAGLRATRSGAWSPPPITSPAASRR